ncbi:MAG: hypothetical protein AVO33_07075 [delta proteobacterium ML8_F1]|nr:MAG: hypothetical protein AVO33_07075 [delta proteobacterium ML8_F1]
MNNHLIFSGVDVTQIAKEYATPLYVMSHDILIERIRLLKSVFTEVYPNTRILYASKAFLNTGMVQILKSEGIGMDVVSGGELYTGLMGGMDPEDIFFHGNNKSPEELGFALGERVGTIVVDNLYELKQLRELTASKGIRQKILLRLSPGLKAINTHAYIVTGQRDTKFGFQIDRTLFEKTIPEILKDPGLSLEGFHFHIGSQLFEGETYIKAFHVILDLVKELKATYAYLPRVLNIGGGFGIPYDDKTEPLDMEKLFREIMTQIDEGFAVLGAPRPQVIIEPGRWIAGPAGITLYTLGAIKTIKNTRTYVAIDGGMADNIRPALYSARYAADVANKINKEKSQVYTIAGRACESGDILIWDVLLPTIESGDLLAVYHTGAYNFSMANNYNRFLIPPVVLVKDGKTQLMVKGQTYEDLIQRDIKL